ncbi:hypothetical protein AB0K15_41615 [Amycolatopsis sp. NPDC049253]|uniref:hypothetical protein n=1 Tax=Amycolatopsis sp. NPDC049253 TaxID=3155274 RepID=UPI00342108E1
MHKAKSRSERVARVVIMILGAILMALGVAAGGALVLVIALAQSNNRDWAGSGSIFTAFGLAAAWTVLAGAAAVWSSRRTNTPAIWLTGLPSVTLGAAPAAFVAFDLLFLIPG